MLASAQKASVVAAQSLIARTRSLSAGVHGPPRCRRPPQHQPQPQLQTGVDQYGLNKIIINTIQYNTNSEKLVVVVDIAF